jgi:PhnB protein
MNLPKGHQTVMPYLITGAAKFLDFTKTVFDARETHLTLTDDKKVMHAEIMIGSATIMLGDSGEQWKPRPASLYIYSDDVDRDYIMALKHNAISLAEPEDKPYGRTCGVEDEFGNVWWITSYPKN